MRKQWEKLGAGIFLIVVLWAGAALAGDKFLIKPTIKSDYRVDTNFYSSAWDERTVSTYTISPGLEAGYRTEKSKIYLLGFLNMNWYEDLDDVPAGMADSNENDFIGHNITLSADTMLFTRIKTGFKGTMIQTRNPEERDTLGNFTDTEKYSINRFSPWIKYQVSNRISAGLGANTTNIDYAAATGEDSFLLQVKGRLYYELTKLITIDLECALGDMDYDMASWDYTSRRYGANIASKFKYFELGAGLGYHERDFDQAGASNLDTPYWHISIKGQNPNVLDPGEKPRSYMTLEFSQDFNDTGDDNEYYRADRVSFTLGHLFMEKIDAKLTGYYQKSDYENSALDRSDDTLFLSVALSYFMNEWFTFILESGMESRQSSVDYYDYDNSYGMFKITFNYDLGSR